MALRSIDTSAGVVSPACAHHSATMHAPRAMSCSACGHRLEQHDGYPADTSCESWHTEFPETHCAECGCEWAEEPTPWPYGIRERSTK